MQLILDQLLLYQHYEYLLMALVLGFCGLGLPVPEEITLLASGILVGWQRANFWWSTLACSSGILVGDSCMFCFGRYLGSSLLDNWFMQYLLPPKRIAKFSNFFTRHRNLALFLARFFPGIRIGVYTYAGSVGEHFMRFFLLDLLGVVISAPTSILLGRWAALAFADTPEAAMHFAQERAHQFGRIFLMIVLGIGLVLLLSHMLVGKLWKRLEKL